MRISELVKYGDSLEKRDDQINHGVSYMSNHDKEGNNGKYVIDLSLIISGAIRSEKIRELSKLGTFYISNSLINHLKRLADKGIEQGVVGLNELYRLSEIGGKIEIVFDSSIAGVPLDDAALQLARKLNATLLTSNEWLWKIARAAGIDTIHITLREPGKLTIRDSFDQNTLSIHLKDGVRPMAKRGIPGKWEFVPIREEPMTKEE